MNPKRTITIISFHPASLSEMYLFLSEALGSCFSTNYDQTKSNNEIVFFGDSETVLVLKAISPTTYQLTIESESGQVVRGMIGYLEEVIDETSVDYTLRSYT